MERPGIASSKRGTGDSRSAGGRDRRVDERFDLNRAPGTLLHKGTDIPCEMLDISLSGCRLKTTRPFTEGALESVKVTLSIHDMVLSIWGITQWTSRDRLLGIRFVHPTGRTRNQLAGLLTCLLDKSAAEVVKRAVAAAAKLSDSPIIALEHPLAEEPEPKAEPAAGGSGEGEPFQAPPRTQEAPSRPQLISEHKILTMKEGASPAVIRFVLEGTMQRGSLLDVSQDGCLVRLARTTMVRPNAQAEVDFRLRGLPFLLPGLTSQVYADQLVEIRFTEMSKRKREDLSGLIMELHMQNQAAAEMQAGPKR